MSSKPSPNRSVAVVPYNPDWPREFESIATHIRKALGSLALRIDHIGSTSISGMAAKDVIDIQVLPEGLDLEEDITVAFAELGFSRQDQPWNRRDHIPEGWKGAETEWDKLVFAPPTEDRLCNVHVRVRGRANARYALLFRDYLRADEAAARGWAEFKIWLAEKFSDDLSVYGFIKDPATDVLMRAAEMWAERVGWVP